MIKPYPVNKEYFISDHGDVFRVTKLKPQKNRNGYIRVQIFDNKEKKRVNKMVHKLVIETFKGKIPAGMQVNHIDKIRDNARLDNLEIVTALENTIHRDEFIEAPF